MNYQRGNRLLTKTSIQTNSSANTPSRQRSATKVLSAQKNPSLKLKDHLYQGISAPSPKSASFIPSSAQELNNCEQQEHPFARARVTALMREARNNLNSNRKDSNLRQELEKEAPHCEMGRTTWRESRQSQREQQKNRVVAIQKSSFRSMGEGVEKMRGLLNRLKERPVQ